MYRPSCFLGDMVLGDGLVLQLIRILRARKINQKFNHPFLESRYESIWPYCSNKFAKNCCKFELFVYRTFLFAAFTKQSIKLPSY